ncbi:MAG: hypothetical protein IKM30_05260 [Oscillospiraceae bacterium]|nr:hypothetical protein [Oscillospiraceae bacterium]
MLQTQGRRYEKNAGEYARMYQTYRAALRALDARRRALCSELKCCMQHKAGNRQSAYQQYRLEQRIALLTEEYGELAEAMRCIAVYANGKRGACV